MNNDQDEINMSTFLYIIEEYVLLGFVPFNEFPSLMQIIYNKYQFANALENSEDSIEIKTACLNLATTLLLLIYESKGLENLKIFEVFYYLIFIKKKSLNFVFLQKILIYIVFDILNMNFDKMMKGIIGFKTSLMCFFNRFVIQGPQDILIFLKSNVYFKNSIYFFRFEY